MSKKSYFLYKQFIHEFRYGCIKTAPYYVPILITEDGPLKKLMKNDPEPNNLISWNWDNFQDQL